jgi:agmatinase
MREPRPARDRNGAPYTGLATFLGWPAGGPHAVAGAAPAPQEDESATSDGRRLVALGVPYDEGTPYRPGSRLAPRAIRDASMRLRFASQDGLGFFDVQRRRGVRLGAAAWDGGDVAVVPLRQEQTFAAVQEVVGSVRGSGDVPVVLGGDNSITLPVLRGVASAQVVVVQLDAHLDYGEGYFGGTHGNSTPMRSIRREGLARQILHLGTRGYDNAHSDLEATEADGNVVIPADAACAGDALAAVRGLDPGTPVYLSLDIDVADPAIAPGTGYPEPGGLDYRRLRELMLAVGSRCELLGCELVEVSPPYDLGGVTALLGTQLLLDLLGASGTETETIDAGSTLRAGECVTETFRKERQ